MKNIKIKIANFNYTIINFFNNIFQLKKYRPKKLVKISKFNKGIIFLISLLFLYLFYLSIPSIYDKERLQKEMAFKLNEEFKIDFSFSSEISYSILPSPHIFFKNAKIFNNQSDTINELAQIKELKIFISQKNLFDQDKIEIKKIMINRANFSIKKNDFNFINNFINKKFSEKKIIIKNSNFFYKTQNNETISIFKILNLELFLNIKKFFNQINSNGRVYQIPFNLNWTKNLSGSNSKKTAIEIGKLNLKMINNSFIDGSKYIANNKLIIGGDTLIFNYKIEDDLITFNSNNSKLLNDNLKYDGLVQLDPFDLILNVDSKQFNYNKLLSINSFLQEILKTNLLFNKNINAKISFTVKDILNNKLFDNLIILLNFNNGNINLNKSYISNNKVGKLNLDYGKIFNDKNQLIFKGKFNFGIKNEEQFFRVFQVPKKNRLRIKNIYFGLEYNLFNEEFKITSFKLNDLNLEENDIILDLLDDYNNDNKIKNWIDVKNFINKIFLVYDE